MSSILLRNLPKPNRVSRSFLSIRMSTFSWTPNNYPHARRSDHIDEYKSEIKGLVKVADPYQWLEKNTAETDEWTSAQESFTRTYLDVGSSLASISLSCHTDAGDASKIQIV